MELEEVPGDLVKRAHGGFRVIRGQREAWGLTAAAAYKRLAELDAAHHKPKARVVVEEGFDDDTF